MEKKENGFEGTLPVTSLVVVFSYHHKNTEKIAKACAEVLGAEVKTPQQVKPEEITEYDLVGFGSGIYSATFGASMLDLADRLPQAGNTKAFLFSTYGAPAAFVGRGFVENNHSQVREKLQAKGYEVIGEFGCAGWNTNSFLNYFGGLNKGRPNAEDLKNAGTFARSMMEKARG
ncbi:MAG: flavodoxin family protein [Methanomicrobiales archaeon]